ncbi:MAG: hypothetical protein A3E01_00405 [Gammaproteobacteria bacterium RIFCSPHIGHO2_12_FULL_63_22]|nr:MAG: hypothetical protein A3E01_00405 [Gammaproteobacteria bacterium RIFCSPHIGHO2_12_FULL_63_22]
MAEATVQTAIDRESKIACGAAKRFIIDSCHLGSLHVNAISDTLEASAWGKWQRHADIPPLVILFTAGLL